MFNKKTIKDIDITNKIVLVRVDYNVPMKDGVVVSDLRIRANLPTIQYLHEHGAKKIILISHLGRPEGQIVPEMSLAPVAKVLQDLVKDIPVNFVNGVSGTEVETAVANSADGGIVLLENLRFFPGEEANSADFIKEIITSTHAEAFVQDGFAVVHRAHASTEAVTHELPSVAGLLLEKEVGTLGYALDNPAKPVLVIIGGAKVDDKQPLIDAFADRADNIAVLGKIAADGYTADASIADKVYVAEDFHQNAEGAKLDVGEKSVAKVNELVRNAKTIIWNGAAGLVEEPEFAWASEAIATEIGHNTEATTIICGGDTAGFIENYAAEHADLQYSLISTGGGASLELLSGATLPGVASLEDR